MLQKNEEVLNQVYQAVTVPIIKKDTIGHMKLSGCNADCYVIDHQPTSRKMVIRVDVRNRSGIKDYHAFFFLDMDLQTGFKAAKLTELDVNEEVHTVTYCLSQEPSLEMGAEFRSLVPGSINSLIEYIDVTIMDLDKDIFVSFPTDIRYIANDPCYLISARDFNNYIDLKENYFKKFHDRVGLYRMYHDDYDSYCYKNKDLIKPSYSFYEYLSSTRAVNPEVFRMFTKFSNKGNSIVNSILKDIVLDRDISFIYLKPGEKSKLLDGDVMLKVMTYIEGLYSMSNLMGEYPNKRNEEIRFIQLARRLKKEKFAFFLKATEQDIEAFNKLLINLFNHELPDPNMDLNGLNDLLEDIAESRHGYDGIPFELFMSETILRTAYADENKDFEI